MELRYDDLTKSRLRHWRDSDPPLYEAAVSQLNAIKTRPLRHGVDGTPLVRRLVVFGVNGREDEYVVTWSVPSDGAVFIGFVGSVVEMQQRSRLRGRG